MINQSKIIFFTKLRKVNSKKIFAPYVRKTCSPVFRSKHLHTVGDRLPNRHDARLASLAKAISKNLHKN